MKLARQAQEQARKAGRPWNCVSSPCRDREDRTYFALHRYRQSLTLGTRYRCPRCCPKIRHSSHREQRPLSPKTPSRSREIDRTPWTRHHGNRHMTHMHTSGPGQRNRSSTGCTPPKPILLSSSASTFMTLTGPSCSTYNSRISRSWTFPLSASDISCGTPFVP